MVATAHEVANSRLQYPGSGTQVALGRSLVCGSAARRLCAIKEAVAVVIGCSTAQQQHGNEREVGLAIAEAIDEGLVMREDLWVVSKLFNTHHCWRSTTAAGQRENSPRPSVTSDWRAWTCTSCTGRSPLSRRPPAGRLQLTKRDAQPEANTQGF